MSTSPAQHQPTTTSQRNCIIASTTEAPNQSCQTFGARDPDPTLSDHINNQKKHKLPFSQFLTTDQTNIEHESINNSSIIL